MRRQTSRIELSWIIVVSRVGEHDIVRLRVEVEDQIALKLGHHVFD